MNRSEGAQADRAAAGRARGRASVLPARRVSSGVRALWLAGSLGLLASQAGCATVNQYNRDTVLSTKTLRTLAADWTFAAVPQVAPDKGAPPSSLDVVVTKDKACVITEVRSVDRTFVTAKTMQNEERSRRMGYTLGASGVAGGVPAYVLAIQAKTDEERIGYGVIAGIGTYLSIFLIVQIAREFEAIDHEEHIGKMDLYDKKQARCDAQPAAGAHVRLVHGGTGKLAEGTVDAKGTVVLPVDPSALQADGIYGVEVDGEIVQHVEVRAAKPAVPAATPAP